MSARTHTALWTLGVVALALAAFATSAWLHARSSDADWARVRARAAVIGADRPRGERPHAPLRGAARAGEATQHYLLATRENYRVDRTRNEQGRDPDEPHMWELIAQRELPAKVAELLSQYQPVLDALAAGAASDRIQFDTFRLPLERGVAVDEVQPLDSILGFQLAPVVLVAARHDLARGVPESALQRTADVLTLARDQMQAGRALHELFGTGDVAACCDLWTDDALTALPPPLQREFVALLLRFDAETPVALQSVRSEATRVVEAAFRDPSRGDLEQMVTEWFADDPADRCVEPEQLDAYFDAIDALPAATAPWSVREPALAAASARVPRLRIQLAEIERHRREALTRIRMLRIALAHHLGDPLPALADPLGDGVLQVSERGGELVIESRGTTHDYERGEDEPIARIVRRR